MTPYRIAPSAPPRARPRRRWHWTVRVVASVLLAPVVLLPIEDVAHKLAAERRATRARAEAQAETATMVAKLARAATYQPACDAPNVICGGRCVDLTSDDNNCGACGRACTSSAMCWCGECGLTADIPPDWELHPDCTIIID